MAILNFNKMDQEIVEQFYKENKTIFRKTVIKEQSLYKPENWWYFFNLMAGEENKKFRTYIQSTLRRMAHTSLQFAILYLLTSEEGSQDEANAMATILFKVNSIKGKLRKQTIDSLYACVEVSSRMHQKI